MVRAQDSAIEYLLALQAKPRPRRVVCCNPGVWAVCHTEKCACAEVMTCATDLDASFSSQGSDGESIEAEARSGQVVHEARVQARPARLTQPSRISVVQVPTRQVVQPVQVHRVSVVQGPGTPRSQALGTPPVKVGLGASQVSIARPALSAAGSSRSLHQAKDLGSPCSTRSAPVLAEARSIAALPAVRWTSAATALTGSRRVQVRMASTTPVSTPRSNQSCAQVAVTPRSTTHHSYQPPLPADGHHDSLQRSRSWQPHAAPSVAALPVLLPMRYTVGSATLKRPPMAQVVS
mmetsp:Transcript_61629/g.135003  ORF Transcript_61629/g.135003 Transcript_61629/m.135003 type:complete len:292 (-) Transcript_61629:226-1101(-)